MKKILIYIFLVVLMVPTVVSAKPIENLKAAFIRNNDLWIKNGEREIKITNAAYIRYPKWSFDGSWVAYLKRSKDREGMDLWLYHLNSNHHYRVKENVSNNFQWAPNENLIGFQVIKNLFMMDTSQFRFVYTNSERH